MKNVVKIIEEYLEEVENEFLEEEVNKWDWGFVKEDFEIYMEAVRKREELDLMVERFVGHRFVN